MRDYVVLSLETHLFFGRIMKEHALFLLAGFPAKEMGYRQRANRFRQEFEEGLWMAVRLSNGVVGREVLSSGEVVTEFTLRAERQTEGLTGIPIDSRITQAEKNLQCKDKVTVNQDMVRSVRRLNNHMLDSLDGLIGFKEQILKEVSGCRLFTFNYPLLIEHILREARLYRQTIMELERRGCIPERDLREMETFWNQIMMEHAQFIRGLLDPTECELIDTADDFAKDYCRLLKEAKEKDMYSSDELKKRTMRTTEKYQQFKTEGTKGITECRIRSLILPLLADHVLREANHFLRILGSCEKGRD